jgi:hypothetical protein
MLGGDFAVHRARSDTRFTTPNPSIANATTAAERTVSDYRLGSLGGAYSFPTEQGALVVGMSFHQTGAFGRSFDVTGENTINSITGSLSSDIAFEAGAIDGFALPDSSVSPAADPGSPAVAGEMVLGQRENVFESGQINELSFGAAVEVASGVMLGGGLNIAFGSYTFERFYRETDDSGLLPPLDLGNLQPPYDPYFVPVDSTISLEGFRSLRLEEQIDTDINGISLRAGLSAEVASGLRWGLLVETPTWYNLTEVFGTRIATDFDCESDLEEAELFCPEGGVEGFESGSLEGNEFSYRIRTPWRIGTGLQYTRSGLTLAGDVEIVDWTQANVSSDDADFGDLNRQIRGLDATLNTQFGAEYDFDVAAVRAGVAYRPDPRDQSFQDVDGQSTDGDRLFLSAGASFTPSENFTLHLNWMQERFDDTFQSYTDGPFVREAVAQNQFLIGVTYRP